MPPQPLKSERRRGRGGGWISKRAGQQTKNNPIKKVVHSGDFLSFQFVVLFEEILQRFV